MSARLLVCTLVLGVGVASACGGATDSGLFGGGGGSGADSGSNVDASGTHDGGVVDHDGSTPVDASPHVDGNVPHDASPPIDTGPPPDLVACMGTAGCKVGTDSCCRTTNGQNTTYACVPLGQCNGQGDTLEIPCDKQRDCELLGAPGDVCCVTGAQGTTGGASDVSCQPSASCTAQQGRARLCDPQMAGACVAPLTCQPSMSTIPGYTICR